MKRIIKLICWILTVVTGIAIVVSVFEKDEERNGWSKDHKPKGIYERFLKRPLDLFLSLLGILVTWPLMLVVAIMVRVKLGGQVLFKQERPGLNGEIFTLYKFRTMTDERDDNGELLSDEDRLTGFGKWLRSTSLDELPEMINILKGDMSFVGPRPLLVRYLPLYNEEQSHRHDVRPGLTGYAQVNGRNALTWKEKFEFDIKYVNSITFLGDLRIMIDTFKSVLRHEGIDNETSETMEEYMGGSSGDE